MKTTIIALILVLGGALSACSEAAEGTDSTPRSPIEQTAAPEQVTSDPPCLPGSRCVR